MERLRTVETLLALPLLVYVITTTFGSDSSLLFPESLRVGKQESHSYRKGEVIRIFANTIFPSEDRCGTRPYLDFPFCTQAGPIKRTASFEQIVSGDCWTNTRYWLKFNVNTSLSPICRKNFTKDEVVKLREAIEKGYEYDMFAVPVESSLYKAYQRLRIWISVQGVPKTALNGNEEVFGLEFHLNLKESLTIFRYSEFPFDRGSWTKKRIADVSRLERSLRKNQKASTWLSILGKREMGVVTKVGSMKDETALPQVGWNEQISTLHVSKLRKSAKEGQATSKGLSLLKNIELILKNGGKQHQVVVTRKWLILQLFRCWFMGLGMILRILINEYLYHNHIFQQYHYFMPSFFFPRIIPNN